MHCRAVQIEVNSAKAAMYDDINLKYEKVQEQLARADDSHASECAELKFLRTERDTLTHQLCHTA